MIRVPMTIQNGALPFRVSRPPPSAPRVAPGVAGLKNILSDLTRSNGPCRSCGH